MRTLLALLVCTISALAVEPGQRAPGFALPDSKLNVVDLYDFRGKPVILEFMKTDCPHCAAFATALERLQAKFGDKVSIIAVANPPDTIGTVASYIKGHNINYPVLFDMGQAAFSYLRTQQFDLPQVYLIDANGFVFNHYGYSALTVNLFEGDSLWGEIDRMMKSFGPKASPKSGASSATRK